MTEIKLHTYGERLIVSEKVTLSSGDINSATLSVEFDEAWKEYPNKSAVFSREGKPDVEAVIMEFFDESGEPIGSVCKIPYSVLRTKGVLGIGIRALSNSGADVLTSTIIKYNIEQGANPGEMTLEPDMDLYQQYLAAMDEGTAALFNSYKATLDADYAEFKADLLGKLSGTLLWENEKPDELFAAQQIPLDLAKYRRFVLVYRIFNNRNECAEATFTEKNLKYRVSLNPSELSENRFFTIDDTKLDISDHSGASNYINQYIIPYKLYGFEW